MNSWDEAVSKHTPNHILGFRPAPVQKPSVFHAHTQCQQDTISEARWGTGGRDPRIGAQLSHLLMVWPGAVHSSTPCLSVQLCKW